MESSAMSKFTSFLQKVKRSRTEKQLGGVCAGLAAHSEFPAWVYRVMFIILLMLWGLGGVAYLALWICMPVEEVLEPAKAPVPEPANTSA